MSYNWCSKCQTMAPATGPHQCGQPTQIGSLQDYANGEKENWCIRELMRLSEENGRLKQELETFKGREKGMG